MKLFKKKAATEALKKTVNDEIESGENPEIFKKKTNSEVQVIKSVTFKFKAALKSMEGFVYSKKIDLNWN